MTARGACERCGTSVIGERADPRVWAHCVCVGCLPPAPRLPITKPNPNNQHDEGRTRRPACVGTLHLRRVLAAGFTKPNPNPNLNHQRDEGHTP